MSGYIYCFNTVCDHKIYKAGHTQQDELSYRLKSYLGPSKPRVVVASRHVVDSVDAEKMLLGLLRQSSAVKPRIDLGDEWFEACHDDTEEIHKAILFIFDVVAKAAGKKQNNNWSNDTHITTCSESTSQITSLPAMGSYFEALDRFIIESPTNDIECIENAVNVFEKSEKCPIFADFVMWPKATRLAVACNRYPYISRKSGGK